MGQFRLEVDWVHAIRGLRTDPVLSGGTKLAIELTAGGQEMEGREVVRPFAGRFWSAVSIRRSAAVRSKVPVVQRL